MTVIMAAGKGKRMLNDDLPKVMHEVTGKPMVDHVVDLALKIGVPPVIVIVGFRREMVMEHLSGIYGQSVTFAIQAEQLGTGHAVMQTEELLKGFDGDVLVLSGDVPLLTALTMQNLIDSHHSTGAAMTVLTAKVDDPTGYGRIIRLPDGSVDRIVEHKDATADEMAVDEINSGIYVFKRKELFDALRHITPENSQHEYYLTDVFGYFVHHGMRVSAVLAKHFDEIRGVNTVSQLKEAEAVLKSNSPFPGRKS
jgi:UDP-N-acetylglucosamine diphosphorylase/glucosamine-1-phosphate N-acetyltransferase